LPLAVVFSENSYKTKRAPLAALSLVEIYSAAIDEWFSFRRSRSMFTNDANHNAKLWDSARRACGPVEVGTDAPDFSWIDETGERVRLSDLRGQPALVAFFPAEWNPARSYFLQIYNEVLRRMPSTSRVFGFAQDGQWCEIMLDAGELRFPLLGSFGVDGEIARRYGALGIQAIFVIGADGLVIWRHTTADGMEAHLDDLGDALEADLERALQRQFLLT
jgi:peroxiredoxin